MNTARQAKRAAELRHARLRILDAAEGGLVPNDVHPLASLRGLVSLGHAQEHPDGRFTITATGRAALANKGKPQP